MDPKKGMKFSELAKSAEQGPVLIELANGERLVLIKEETLGQMIQQGQAQMKAQEKEETALITTPLSATVH